MATKRRTRQEKYPNTNIFTYHNQNPYNKITSDCVPRAISFALGLDYAAVVKEMAEIQCLTGIDIRDNREDLLLKRYGYDKQPMLKHHDNTKYTLKEFVRRFPKGTYLIHMPHHLTVVKDGKNYDIFDCTKTTVKLGNYWIIKGE